MKRRTSCLLLVAFFSIGSSICIAEDPIKVKLDKAKADYEVALDKFRTGVGEYFDKREGTARKSGKKKAVDEIKAERAAFQEKDELPEAAPANLKQKKVSARKSLEEAYDKAIAEYTKAKLDKEASDVEKELEAFRAAGATDTRRRWVHDKGQFKKLEADKWEESYPNSGTVFHYKETARTKEYIQIDAITGNTSVRFRLYDTRVDRVVKPNLEYEKLFTGKWVK